MASVAALNLQSSDYRRAKPPQEFKYFLILRNAHRLPPRKNRAAFLESDRIKSIDLPQNGDLLNIAKRLESAMKADSLSDVRTACAEFLTAATDFYKVPRCSIRVLAARPLRVRESWATELFGDYHPATMLIRVWMRTAVRKEVTSSGTFLSTLCHEFCHHLDFQLFHCPDS